jgi:GntR family transcriptional repressor for pyruvate dehydrogenase complex
MILVGSSRKKLADHVIDEIKRMLMEGELRAGDKLPNQTDFASQLGVSRLSLREALNALTRMGVIKQKPGFGTMILSDDPRLWGEKPLPPVLSDEAAALELLESRKAIETAIVGLAMQRISKEEIGLLAEDIHQMKRAQGQDDTMDYMKHDMSFHFRIASASHNRYMIHMFLTIRGLMEQFMAEIFSAIPALLVDSFQYHERIYSSIKKRDGVQAALHMEEHISNIANHLKDYYRRGSGRNPSR